MIRQLSAKALERFLKDKREEDYRLIDVRLHEEYRLDHIPGSTNIPLAEIQFDPYMFDDDKKLLFYCRSGRRSQVAAIFVAETGYPDGQLYNLKGGMVEYSGEILMNYPRVDLLPPDEDPVKLMERSIDLEKGAHHFYSRAKEKLKGTPLHEVMTKMVQAEISHAKSIYNMMKKSYEVEMDFELFFNSCSGSILEGGKSITEANSVFEGTGMGSCLDILEFAIELEYCAYDLYKIAAQGEKNKELEQMFHMLAQAEKKHLEKLIQSLELCEIIS